ncbi:MAG: MBL fold metallo-hydrolase [Desulfobulbaceae bacterium]|nr:MBL fold metallo-hydrolase [Desulfobulbaceae bacterium]
MTRIGSLLRNRSSGSEKEKQVSWCRIHLKPGFASPLVMLQLVLLSFSLLSCTHAQPPAIINLPVHHTADGFRNPCLPESKRSFFRYFRMRYSGDVEYPDYEENASKVPTVKADLDQIRNPQTAPQVTWIGHATVLIQYRGIAILTDPIFSDRASPVTFLGPKRVHPPALSIEDLPKIDYVVLSHNHYDHLDLKSVRDIGSDVFWLVPLGLKKWFVNAGIKEEKVIEFDWWDKRQFDRVIISATPAQHWSSRSLWDKSETLWVSWLMQIDDFTVWYSGDTGYNPCQFREIGAAFDKIDLSLITIGAYEPRWFMKDMHINPAEAVQIHRDIGAEYSLGIQWGTFRMTAEPIEEPPVLLKDALMKNNIPLNKFETVKIGETKKILKLDGP